MRLLLVEDDQKIGAFVEKGLRQEGHAVDWVRDGREAAAVVESAAYDAAIVDIMLPGLSGLELIRAVRGKRIATPIIILSARDAVADRVEGLEAGADDYLTKPFSFAELVARLNALARRATAANSGESRLSYAGLTLDLLTTAGHPRRRLPLAAGQRAGASRVLPAESGACAQQDHDPAAAVGLLI